MKSNLFISAFVAMVVSSALAGPNVSNGPVGTENMVSKQKIIAILSAITGVNEVVQSVSISDGGQLYTATIRTGEACQESLYKITPFKSKPGTYLASFVDMISSGPCKE